MCSWVKLDSWGVLVGAELGLKWGPGTQPCSLPALSAPSLCQAAGDEHVPVPPALRRGRGPHTPAGSLHDS